MLYTPQGILNYIHENELETDFILSLTGNKYNFSIGEIADKRIEKRGELYYLVSNGFSLDVEIKDDSILTGVINGLYDSCNRCRT